MARKSRTPEELHALNHYKSSAMKDKGYNVKDPDQLKYEVAQSLGIPLNKGYNGNITSENAGKIGGQIGGSMVKKMIAEAKKQISEK